MTDYAQVIAEALAHLRDPGRTTDVGMRLQDLAQGMLAGVSGVVVTAQNVLNAAGSEEKDLWFGHSPHLSSLPFADLLVPVECKNEATPLSSDEVTRFEPKIRDSGGSDGLIVSRAGLAGIPGKSAHMAIEKALGHGVRIVVVTAVDLGRVSKPEDFVILLKERMTELRTRQTYHSI